MIKHGHPRIIIMHPETILPYAGYIFADGGLDKLLEQFLAVNTEGQPYPLCSARDAELQK
jgi:hypothetical protein